MKTITFVLTRGHTECDLESRAFVVGQQASNVAVESSDGGLNHAHSRLQFVQHARLTVLQTCVREKMRLKERESQIFWKMKW